MNEKMDMRISGSSTMPGGEYDRAVSYTHLTLPTKLEV